MTFKTDIKFDDSPILRSLERVAIKKGLVVPDPVVKTAAVKEAYVATDDLHEDMLTLVAGLRAKGFHREAEALEDKVNMRKMAETHLYRAFDEDGDDLLDFAHPDGDVEVAPSASGLGKVWTEQSAKKEILRVVQKQPTGKYAAVKKTANVDPRITAALKVLKDEYKGWAFTFMRAILAQVETIEGKDSGDINWQGNDFRNTFGAGRSLNEVALTDVKNYLYNVLYDAILTHNKDPESYFERINSVIPKEIKQLASQDTQDDPDVNVYPVIQKYFDGTKYIGNVKDIITKKKQAKYNNQYEYLAEAWYKEIKAAIPAYIDYIVDNPNDNEVKGWRDDWMQSEGNFKKLWANRVNNGGYITRNMNWAIRPILEQEGDKDIRIITNLMGRLFANFKAWANKNNRKTGSAKNVTKLGGYPGQSSETTTVETNPTIPGTGGTSGARGGGTSITLAIQQELLNLRNLIQKNKGDGRVIEVLGLPKFGPDKRWGSETMVAIRMAESVRKNQEGKIPSSPPIQVQNSQSTVDAIKALITSINSGKGGGSGYKQEGEVFDDYAGVKITSQSLASPADFYQWLVKAVGLRVTVDGAGDEFLKISDFENTLNSIQQRAIGWKDSVAGSTSTDTQVEDMRRVGRYIRAVRALKESWYKVIELAAKDYGKGYTVDYVRHSNVIHTKYLRMASGGRGGSAHRQGGPGAGDGSTNAQGAGGKDYDGTIVQLIGGKRIDFSGLPESDIIPISRHLDLRDTEWWDTELDVILDYYNVKDMSGPNFAISYFSDAGPVDRDTVMQAAYNAKYPPNSVRYSESRKEVYVANGNRWIPASSVPAIMQQMSYFGGQDANTRALNFIRDIRGQLTSVWKRYLRGITNPELRRSKNMSALEGEMQAWQQLFVKLERQIEVNNRTAKGRQRG